MTPANDNQRATRRAKIVFLAVAAAAVAFAVWERR